MISTNFAVSAANAVPARSTTSANLVTSSTSVVQNNSSSGCNAATEKNKMTNFSIAAIMNNERGSGLIRPTPMTENTKLGKNTYIPKVSLF